MKKVIIIGAGASGLACASALANFSNDYQITILEQSNKIARKLLASGNGRCNLSNLDMSTDAYNTCDSKIETIISHFDPKAFFQDRGMLVREENNLLYPNSMHSHTVKQVLLDSLKNTKIIENCKVKKIIKENNHYICISDKKQFHGDYVVIACGSKAGNLSGNDNEKLLQQLKLKMTPLKASLVPLKCKQVYKQLKGIRVKASVSLYDNKTLVCKQEGEVLFTDYGLSGICIMQLSRYVHKVSRPIIHIDLLPKYNKKELSDLLTFRHKQFDTYYYEGMFHHQLAKVIDKNHIDVKDMVFEVIDTLDVSRAQVLSGGVCLEEVDEDLQCYNYPNLYIIGEALDVDGDCGGYNLHFAFGSGKHVAGAIIKSNKI